jgi:hypothetical protein
MKKSVLFAGVILLAVLTRLVPHPANFSPIAAISLMSGAYFGRKSLGFLLPVALMFFTDMILGFYPGVLINYIGMVAVYAIASVSISTVIAGSAVFFVISNLGVWIASGLYAHTLSGLVECYVRAVPFFGNTLLGDLTYSFVIFAAVYGLDLTSRTEVTAS